MTSFDVIARLRRTLGVRRLGHAGTLDPEASGVLPVAVGQATRLLEYLEHDKCYRTRVRLGVRTDTLDAAGQVVEEQPVPVLVTSDIDRLLPGFLGWQDQVPPMASAIHHQGRRLHELFREGQTVQLTPRRVRIDHLVLHGLELPFLDLEMACGGGTYVRSLVRDLGDRVGCGAHVQTLERTRSGAFELDDAVELDALEAVADDIEALQRSFKPVAQVLTHMARLTLEAELAGAICQGRRVRLEPACQARLREALEGVHELARRRCDPQGPQPEGEWPVLLVSEDGRALAVAWLDESGVLHPRKVLGGTSSE